MRAENGDQIYGTWSFDKKKWNGKALQKWKLGAYECYLQR